MAGPLIGALRVSLSAETASFEAGMKRAQRTTSTAAAGIGKSLGIVKAGLTGFAAALSIGLLERAIKRSLDYAASIYEVSKQLGVTTKELQTFRFAAGQNGASVEEADKALGKFALSISKARSGSVEMAKTFGAVGVSLSDLEKKSKTEILGKIADKMKATGGASANAAAGVAIFGKGFQKIVPVLDQGSKGMNQLYADAQRLGVVLSDDLTKNASNATSKMEALKNVLTAQIANTVAANASSIVSLAQSLNTLTVEIVKFLSSNPQGALAIIGGLAGSRFGLPGAAAGAVAGFIGGDVVARNAADANTDLAFRRQQLHKARDELNSRRAFAANPGALIQFRSGSRNSGATVESAQKEFDKQLRLAYAAAGAAKAGAHPTVPTVPLPQFLAPGAPKAKKAPTDRSDDALFAFEQEQRRADIDILNAKQDLSHSTAERADLALKILEIEKEARDAEIDNQVHHAQQDYADGRITKSALDQVVAQSAILKSKNDQVKRLEAQAIAEQRDEQLRQETNAISEHEYQIRTDILQKQSSLAETAEERRKIELELLQLAYEQKRKVIQDIIDHSKDTVEIANARADLANLNANHALDQATVLQQTRGPLENYLASLPTTAAKANEALQNLEVQGFDGLIDSVLALGDGMHSATESLLNTLKQFLLGLARLELQKALGGILSGSGGGILGSIGNLFGGSSGGSIADPLAGFTSGGFESLHFAGGGSGIFKGIPGRDRNTLALNGIPFANVSYGERMTISNDNGSSRSMGRGDVYMTINTPDADSFRRSEGQTTRSLKRSLA